MAITRRHLMVSTGRFAVGCCAIARSRAARAGEAGARVIVRDRDALRFLDPRTGTTGLWTGPLPRPRPPAATGEVPDAIAAVIRDGSAGYWMAFAEGGVIVRLDAGATPGWWWHGPGGAQPLDLPMDLEPAFPSGTWARWFHGATVDAAHLGAGSLRLLAVDLAAGATVLDQSLDRRLELAAVTVSADGAVVAHVQSATTGLACWVADLRGSTRLFVREFREPAGRAAASAIALDVATDAGAVLLAAGVSWAWPGAPEPVVRTMWASSPAAIRTASLPGELVRIVPRGA